ncbi:MAG: sugar isomerase, partial [Bacteroidetes bacterium]
MDHTGINRSGRFVHTCCPVHHHHAVHPPVINRREFIRMTGGSALSVTAPGGLTWPLLSSPVPRAGYGIKRRALTVKPILVYSVPEYSHQTSWRAWGGIQTVEDAGKEISRIETELRELGTIADFPVKFLPVDAVQGSADLGGVRDLDQADVFLVYAAGGWMDTFEALQKRKKEMIFFCRHRSGPVYLWYEIISPRYLRQHTDTLALAGIDETDVVIDSQEEILWRLRALCGLKNTLNTGIVAVGGPGAWAQPEDVVPRLVEEKFGFMISSVSYDELGMLITEARRDPPAVADSRKRAGEYLEDRSVTLETDRSFVENCFLLEDIFIRIMERAGCRALTINGCMGTIMPLAGTSACLTLSLLNDHGYLSFCESDFVVIPSGVLLANISGQPV